MATSSSRSDRTALTQDSPCRSRMSAGRGAPAEERIANSTWRIISRWLPTLSLLFAIRSLTIHSFHHFFRRHDAPQVSGGWILGPNLGLLRVVAVPGARLEIAELLVHAVELSKGLGNETCRAAMIRKQVVTDAMPAWTPQQLVSVEAEIIASRLQVRPIAQFKGGMEMPIGAGFHQIDGVVVGTATQKREEVRH